MRVSCVAARRNNLSAKSWSVDLTSRFQRTRKNPSLKSTRGHGWSLKRSTCCYDTVSLSQHAVRRRCTALCKEDKANWKQLYILARITCC